MYYYFLNGLYMHIESMWLLHINNLAAKLKIRPNTIDMLDFTFLKRL